MKFKHLLVTLLGVFVSSILAYGQSYSIKLKIKNTRDTIAYLGYHFADKRYVLDTVDIQDETALFSREEPFKSGLYFYYTPQSYFEFIVNEPRISLETEGDNYVQNMKVIESRENKIFNKMQKYVSSKRVIYNELIEQIEENKDDSLKKSEIEKQVRDIDMEVKDFQNKLALENEGTFASRMIHAMQKPHIPDSLTGTDPELFEKRYQFYKSHFFDGIDVADPGLLRSPVLNQKILEYLDEVIVQNPDTVIKEVDWLLSEAKKDPEVFRYALVTFTSKYESSPIMGMDKVFAHLIETYYLTGNVDWVDSATMKKLSDRVATMKPNFIGKPAPTMTLNDTLLNRIALYDIDADYIVLYFYDPDCGHCKKKTPELFAAYPSLKSNNVEVLAICITTDMDRWKEYIRENGFDWINLADSFNKSNFRYYYDIRSTPTIYILDKNKKIIAKKIDASQVESFINQMIELEARGD